MMIPARKTRVPPSTTWKIAGPHGVSMNRRRIHAITPSSTITTRIAVTVAVQKSGIRYRLVFFVGYGNGLSGPLVLPLLLGQVAEQLPDAGVGRAVGGGLVEPPRFHLHRFDPVPRLLRVGDPTEHPLPRDEPLHVVPADE